MSAGDPIGFTITIANAGPGAAADVTVTDTLPTRAGLAWSISAGSDPPADNGSGLGGRVGPLPFTGFDVIAMAAVALAVTGLGLALQRAVSREPSDGMS